MLQRFRRFRVLGVLGLSGGVHLQGLGLWGIGFRGFFFVEGSFSLPQNSSESPLGLEV